jgi:hypothetical protein
MKWMVRAVFVLVAAYVALFGVVLAAMRRPPEEFGQFMKRMPAPVVWGALPARRMWLWARQGELAEGQPAPDFSLSRHDAAGRVTLSERRGRPVVLVFGSYT